MTICFHLESDLQVKVKLVLDSEYPQNGSCENKGGYLTSDTRISYSAAIIFVH